jgi:hypothetical protein
MKTFFELRELNEKFRLPNPPFKYMHINGFSAKFKMNVQAMHDDNTSPQVIKDFKAGMKIVDKHLKKQGMKSVPKIFKGPLPAAKANGIKVGEGAMDFEIDLFPGFRGHPDLPRGKTDDDINLDDMVKELGKLKSFVNFPRSDWSANYGGRDTKGENQPPSSRR